MPAPRSSLRVLSKLARGATSLQRRKLHMTGPATFPSPLLSTETQSRKPSKATAGPPEDLSSEPHSTAAPLRHFNTSRSLKAPGDSSTIDFMYFPDVDPDANTAPARIRIPLLPTAGLSGEGTTMSYASSGDEEEPIIMRAEIITASADSTHISAPAAMHEVHDNNTVDFQGTAEWVAQGTNMAGNDQEGIGMVKEVLGGMFDDIFGAKEPPTT